MSILKAFRCITRLDTQKDIRPLYTSKAILIIFSIILIFCVFVFLFIVFGENIFGTFGIFLVGGLGIFEGWWEWWRQCQHSSPILTHPKIPPNPHLISPIPIYHHIHPIRYISAINSSQLLCMVDYT